MDIPKRWHTHKKEILRFAELDLKNYGMDKEFADFMAYIDDIPKVDPDALTTGQWKKLFAVIRILADKTNRNFCIYQNKWNICFDVTTNCLGTEEEISEDNGEPTISYGRPVESTADKLKRYKYELEQIDLKIAHLQKRRNDYLEKMGPLRMELATLLDELSGYEFKEG